MEGLYMEQHLIDSLGLKLHVSMVYDDDMCERMVELLENKYRQYELDTLVNREMRYNLATYAIDALEKCHFDTFSFFIEKLDSLVRLEPVNRETKKYTVLRLLRLDTMFAYKTIYAEIVKKDEERIRESYLNNPNYDNTYIAELCGYVGDKRFVEPLEKALKLPDNFDTNTVLRALARMKVEPYYTDYLKKRIRTIDDIKNNMPNFPISDFVYVLGNQEAYLEISKYVLSSATGAIDVIDYEDSTGYFETPIYSIALDYIAGWMLNPSLQKIVNSPNFDKNKESDRMKVYKWMQKNYGRYEIWRRW
jgi:hypothetical protein